MIPFFAFPSEVCKVIYTTNAIENINSQLRKIIKTRGHFPSDEAATKLIWFALRNITADWGRAAKDWKAAMNQFAILYADRFVRPSVRLSTRLEHRNSDTPLTGSGFEDLLQSCSRTKQDKGLRDFT